MNSLKLFFRLYLLGLLTSCTSTPENPIKDNQPPVMPSDIHARYMTHASQQFQCVDGQKFSIVFSKNGTHVTFITSDQSTVETLGNNRVASGIEYSNADYVFKEYQGMVTLTDLGQGDEKTTTCRKIHEALK